jgi:hypothetical protein
MTYKPDHILYASIGALTAAHSWPDDSPIGWKFWTSVMLGALVALKAKRSGSDDTETSRHEKENQNLR